MTFNVFISYSTKDSVTARQLYTYLSQIQGTSVFLSESKLIVGQLAEYLITKIKECDLFIVLYSKNSENSNYVQQEIGAAKGNNKIIVPILLDEESKPDAMLKGISYITIYDPEQRNTQMPRLYDYVFQQTQNKINSQMFLALGAIALLGIVFFRDE